MPQNALVLLIKTDGLLIANVPTVDVGVMRQIVFLEKVTERRNFQIVFLSIVHEICSVPSERKLVLFVLVFLRFVVVTLLPFTFDIVGHALWPFLHHGVLKGNWDTDVFIFVFLRRSNFLLIEVVWVSERRLRVVDVIFGIEHLTILLLNAVVCFEQTCFLALALRLQLIRLSKQERHK